MARQSHKKSECSAFIANLDKRVTEELLWELFLQAGPVRNVYIPCDKETGKQKAFGFVEFSSSVSVHYASELLDGIKLFGCPLTVKPQQKDGEMTRIPSNQIPASSFYQDFYSKYNELKHRPQSERTNRWEEESYYHRDNSFSHSFNRSMSSPAHASFSPQQWQQMQPSMNLPMNNWTPYTNSPVANMFFQTPPYRSNWYY